MTRTTRHSSNSRAKQGQRVPQEKDAESMGLEAAPKRVDDDDDDDDDENETDLDPLKKPTQGRPRSETAIQVFFCPFSARTRSNPCTKYPTGTRKSTVPTYGDSSNKLA